MASILVVEARVRRTSGPGLTGQEGHGGGHRGWFGDGQSISQPVNHTSPRSKTFWGWPIVSNANPRSEQSGHRNALSTRKRVSPGQRAQVVCITPYAPVQMAPLRAERQAGFQTKQHPGLVSRQGCRARRGDAPGNGGGTP